jgi:hypothetical protein
MTEIDWRRVEDLLAEHLFGWVKIPLGSDPRLLDPAWRDPEGSLWFGGDCYSVTGDRMLDVVGAMRARGYRWSIDHTEARMDIRARFGRFYAHADTAPRAVALAALKALGVEIG